MSSNALETTVPGLKTHTRDYLLERGWGNEPLASGTSPAGGYRSATEQHCLSDVPYLTATDLQKRCVRGGEKISVTHFERGAKIDYHLLRKGSGGGGREEGAKIKSMSERSRLRLLWVLANSGREWAAMVTLTYPVDPEKSKLGIQAMFQRLRRKGAGEFLWVQENTKRGRLHYHVIMERSNLTERLDGEGTVESRRSGGAARERYSGVLARSIGDDWSEIVLSKLDVSEKTRLDTLKFNQGGIVEPLRHRESAERYMAKELSKKIQKDSEQYAGRWWGASSGVKCSPVMAIDYHPEEITVRKNMTTIIDYAYATQKGLIAV